MSFNYTDEQLNGLNQDYAVYSVNKYFSDRNKQKLVTSNPKNNNETNTITTSDGQEFVLLRLRQILRQVLMVWPLRQLLTDCQTIRVWL